LSINLNFVIIDVVVVVVPLGPPLTITGSKGWSAATGVARKLLQIALGDADVPHILLLAIKRKDGGG
jgi:hypothetical protein